MSDDLIKLLEWVNSKKVTRNDVRNISENLKTLLIRELEDNYKYES